MDLGGGGIGLYTDVGFTGFQHSVAIMGSSMTGSDTASTSSVGSKRSRTDGSCASSGGESSSVDKKMLERERNRRQARKSRTLKKQCTERLQQELNLLRKSKEEAKTKDAEAAQRVADLRAAWCLSLRKVFDLHAAASADEDAWLEVVTADLRLTLPITPYRSFNPCDVVNNRRVMLGVDGIMSDTQSLRVACDNIGVKTRSLESPVSIAYSLGTDGGSDDGAFFNEQGLMCTFTMRTLDAVAHGAADECVKTGMIRARFDSENKIEELDMTFDAIAFYHQLMRASGRNGFPLVPNTLVNALKDKKSRIVVTTAKRPFRITHVNDAWTKLCGFEIEECHGKSLSILQGPETNMAKVANLCAMSQKGYASSMVVTNHNKKGNLFRNHLRCYPVSSDEPGQISHIVGMLTEIPVENKDPRDMRASAVKAF